jgi:hypothetical protein
LRMGGVPLEPIELAFYVSMAVAVISVAAALWALLRAKPRR